MWWFVGLLFAVVALAILKYRFQNIADLSHIPGPPTTHWFWGHRRQIEQQEQHFEWQRKLTETYGFAYKVKLGPFLHRTFVLHPRDVKHALIDQPGSFSKRLFIPYGALGNLLGKYGLVTVTDEDLHTQQRRLVSTAFSPLRLKALTDNYFATEGDRLAANLRRAAAKGEGGIVKINKWFDTSALNLIAKTSFNIDFEDEEGFKSVMEKAQKMRESYPPPTFMERLTSHWNTFRTLLTPIPRVVPEEFQAGRKGEATTSFEKKLMAGIDSSLYDLQNNQSEKREDERTMLDDLAAAIAPDTPASTKREILESHVVTFVMAGFETTAKSMTWISYLLSKDPVRQERLREEVIRIAGRDGTITSEGLKQMTYLQAVIKEGLRLFPAAPLVARLVEKETVLPESKVRLPKNAVVVISPIITQRLEAVWGKDAEEFVPERFLGEENSKLDTDCTWIPFLRGKRNCIGQHFALLELQVLLASMVRSVKLEFPEGQAEPKRRFRVTLKCQGGLHLRVLPLPQE